MIVLFTDFGLPYTGQVKAVLSRHAPNAQVVDLLTDAPVFNAKASAYLLASLVAPFSEHTVFECVVDPGVGSARAAGVLYADGRWYVGPDNGLFEMVARRATTQPLWWEITWRPEVCSSSFHARDVFAPVAARLRTQLDQNLVGGIDEIGVPFGCESASLGNMRRPDWEDDLFEIIYFDSFGNAMTGIHKDAVMSGQHLVLAEHKLAFAETFANVPEGEAFWYINALGLVEIAVAQGNAQTSLGISLGAPLHVL